VLLHTEQPFLAIGLAAVLKSRRDVELVECTDDLAETAAGLASEAPDVALIDVAAGLTLSELRDLHSASPRTAIVLWGRPGPDQSVVPLIPAGTPVEDLVTALQGRQPPMRMLN
jgi:DNA-binding NarL/FixJ family response regulator